MSEQHYVGSLAVLMASLMIGGCRPSSVLLTQSPPTPSPTPIHTPTSTLSLPPTLSNPVMSTNTPQPELAILFQDDFEEGAYQWHIDKGQWQVREDETGNNAFCVSDRDYAYASTGSPAWQDYVLKADVMIVESSDTGGAIIQVRDNRELSCAYEFELEEEYVDFTRIQYAPSFEGNWLAGGPQVLPPGEWHAVHIEAKGSDFLMFLDGEQILRASDPDYIHYGAITIGAGPGLHVCFDNVRVFALESEE